MKPDLKAIIGRINWRPTVNAIAKLAKQPTNWGGLAAIIGLKHEELATLFDSETGTAITLPTLLVIVGFAVWAFATKDKVAEE